MGSGASLWYGAVVRGDVNHVVIGPGSSVGDSAVVHVAGLAGNKPTIVGSDVVIGTPVYRCSDISPSEDTQIMQDPPPPSGVSGLTRAPQYWLVGQERNKKNDACGKS